ncbi:hypothetical protein [Sphingomonas kyungheensis]|uniref:Type II toxin-antitoxin system MqsR family toxin n=1 Tax=Sphingomonas kyungheensis TaxID=1069987 RepID=A0ABU8H7R7_9SPHN
MTELTRELEKVLAAVRAGHDVVPFMGRLLLSAETRLAPLPDDMMSLLSASPDFHPLDPGASPTWFQVAAEEGRNAELVVYRARTDDQHYVIAPSSS